MNQDTFYKKQAMNQTRLNIENTRHDPNLIRNIPRMPTVYGETSIPIESVIHQGALDATRRSAYIIPPNERSINYPQQQNSLVHQNIQYTQPHSQLPYYQYGYQQQCYPTYTLPVYYDGEMKVRQEWERPVNANINQQQWRYVKNQTAQKQIRYKTVVKDDQLIPTQASNWEKYYDSKIVPPPVIPPAKEVKTCCSPLLLGLLGLLALAGIITGIILALNAHNNNVQKPNAVNPQPISSPGPLNPFIPAQPIINNTVNPIPINPNYVPAIQEKPTYVQPISIKPLVNVTTVNATTLPSATTFVTTQPIQKNYTNVTRPITTPTINSNVDFNNDFQVKPTSSSITNTTTNNNNDYQVPPGYIADENGMIVPVANSLSGLISTNSSNSTLTNINGTTTITPSGTTQPQISWQTPNASHLTKVQNYQ